MSPVDETGQIVEVCSTEQWTWILFRLSQMFSIYDWDIRKKLKDIFGKIGCSGTVLLRELKKLQGVMKLHKKDLSKENIPESKGYSKWNFRKSLLRLKSFSLGVIFLKDKKL